MSPGDFLHKDAETPLCEHYLAAGASCSLSTNCEQLLEWARRSFSRLETPPACIDFSLRLWVDAGNTKQPPWPKPYVRGLDHLVFAGFDSGSSIVANLRNRRVMGCFSPAMAADGAYWRAVIFPILLTIVSASVGIAELHCACVTKNDEGFLLAGPSGSGKSTLALALCEVSCGFLSDDRTFCSLSDREVLVWGLGTRLKLRREATVWFQALRDQQKRNFPAEKGDLLLDPEDYPGLHRVRHCRLQSLIFLDRQDAEEFRLSRMCPAEALTRLNEDSMAEWPEAVAKRSEVLAQLVELSCWHLRYGGEPRTIAREILQHFAKA